MNNEPNIQHSPGDELRVRIVIAARDRFGQFGFAKTSMQEIARACDMSAANLYRYYEGKQAIGSAVAYRDQTELLNFCDEAIRGARPEMAEQLIALFQTNIDATRRKMKRAPLLVELAMIIAREEPDLRRQFLREIEHRVVLILAQEHDPSNAFESAAIKLRSRMILMACAPFVLPWMLQNEPFGNPRTMVEPLVRALILGMIEDDGEVVVTKASVPIKKSALSRSHRGV